MQICLPISKMAFFIIYSSELIQLSKIMATIITSFNHRILQILLIVDQEQKHNQAHKIVVALRGMKG